MPALNDVYEVKLFTRALGQNMLNVFHYQATNAVGDSSELANRFGLTVCDKVRVLLSSETIYDHIEVKNQNDPTDFTSWVGAFSNGTRNGIAATPQDALSFVYVSGRTDARSGGKRFGVLAAGDIIDGALTSALATQLGAAEAALESSISGVSCIYRPRIWGQRTTATPLLKFPNPITGVQFNGVYSQNTRKFYTSPGW